MSLLRIESIATRTVSIPLPRPLVSSIHNIDRIGCVLVSIETNANVVGEGLLFTLNDQHLGLMDHMVRELGASIVGEDAEAYEYIWSKLWKNMQFFGSGGFLVFGLSALDMAIWDAVGKYQGRSVAQMLGQSRDRLPVYASAGLFLDRSRDELVQEAKDFTAQGYRAMKIRVGGPSLKDDVARVRAVREAVGDEIKLMADANQALDFSRALALGQALQQFDLTWFEEPMPAYQFDAYSRLCAELVMPVATGESNYTRVEFRRLLESGGADIIMPDLSRIGGITELRKVAALAEIFEVSVSPHLYPEYNLGLIGGIANGGFVENMPWFAPLYNEGLEISDGQVLVPQAHGLGFTFSSASVDNLQIDMSSTAGASG